MDTWMLQVTKLNTVLTGKTLSDKIGFILCEYSKAQIKSILNYKSFLMNDVRLAMEIASDR